MYEQVAPCRILRKRHISERFGLDEFENQFHLTVMLWFRFAPLGALFALFVVGALVRSVVHLRRHGTFGFALARRSWPAVLGLGSVALGQAVLVAVDPSALDALRIGPRAIVNLPTIGSVGFSLVALATLLMVVAQLDLGASWRIGIEEEARPGLVTHGFYRVCRNPIFLFVTIALFGIVLLLPTWLSLGLLVASFLAIRKEVREEERWLVRAYGDSYVDYGARVGRFTPWTGRFARGVDQPG